MTDAGDRLLDMVPGFIGLGIASKFLEKSQGKASLPNDIFGIKGGK